MNKTFVISDCHLSDDNPHTLSLFLNFLAHVEGADALYILGDLFDVWVGDDNPTSCSEKVSLALKQLHTHGTRVFFIKGNRDFLLGKRFAQKSGITLLPDYHLCQAYGNRILMCHGDTLCTDDVTYLRFRKFVRNPCIRFIYLNLPRFYRKRIAQKLRLKSMQYQKTVHHSTIDVTETAVNHVMAAYQAPTLIHGHTHRPQQHHVQHGERIVLGDWHATSAKVIELNKNGAYLFDFAQSQQNIRVKSAQFAEPEVASY